MGNPNSRELNLPHSRELNLPQYSPDGTDYRDKFIQENFKINPETGKREITPLSPKIKDLIKDKKQSPEVKEALLKMEIERLALEKQHKEREKKMKPIITKKFAWDLKELENTMSVRNVRVTPENLSEMNQKLKDFIKNDENIEDNIELRAGDFIGWNTVTQTLSVIGEFEREGIRYTNVTKFQIRFKPETKDETIRNIRLARKMQDDYEKTHPQEKNTDKSKKTTPEKNQNQEDDASAAEKNGKKPQESRENLRQSGKILGDWIVRRKAYPWAANSCGASVGELLNQFGFRKLLPQSGRDGKNWDTIIEKHLSEYFTKIPVSHPNDAPPGSIVVFNEKAGGAPKYKKGKLNPRWTSGHVEIKWSDNLFYSYYDSPTAGGSVHSNKLRGEKYQRYTGFTGYAYVYNGKKPPR